MSGPKGIGYTVVSAEELRRRAIEAGRASVLARRAELSELLARSGAFPAAQRRIRELVASSPSAESNEPEELTRRADVLSARIGEAQELLVHARVEAGRAAVRDAVAGLTVSLDAWGPSAPAERERTTSAGTIKAQLARTAAVVAEHPEVGPEAITSLAEVGRLLSAGRPTQASALLGSLRLRLADLIEAAESERALQRAIEEALRAHDDVPGAAAEALRQQVRDATGLEQVHRLTQRLAACRAEATAAADRAFVFAQVVDVLHDLGYEVDAETPPVDATPILAVKASAPGHGLQLRFRADDPSFYTNVVALGESSPLQDTAAEHQTCADLEAATEHLANRGVRTDFRHRRPAGAVPIQRVAKADERRRQRTSQQQERAR